MRKQKREKSKYSYIRPITHENIDSSADFKEREKELNDHLETMTQIAQKIDYENRELMKKNTELSIQVKSQENDRELLLQ